MLLLRLKNLPILKFWFELLFSTFYYALHLTYSIFLILNNPIRFADKKTYWNFFLS